MKLNVMMLPAGLMLLGACVAQNVEPAAPAPALPSPEQQMLNSAIAMAGPNQNAQTARLNATDNCYWYQHIGPVETTELPLLTATGRPICGPKEVIPTAEEVAS